jgi:hypothetical protein
MLEPSAHIAGGRSDDPVEFAKGGLNAPKASAAKSSYPSSRHRAENIPLDEIPLFPAAKQKGRPGEGALSESYIRFALYSFT